VSFAKLDGVGDRQTKGEHRHDHRAGLSLVVNDG
jgi:hypothetical protein